MIAAASRMISSRMIPRWLVIVLIVATVFNDLQPFLPLGELAKDGFVYVFPLAALLLLRNPGRVALPPLFSVLLLIFIASLLFR